MTSATLDVSQTAITDARARLDAWVRELMAWHFDPETGAPFWLEWARQAGWDPRKEVQSYADLDKFGFFQDEWLRGGPVRRWVPKGYAGPARLRLRDRRQHRRARSRASASTTSASTTRCSATPCPTTPSRSGADWLMVGPSGPRRLRLAVEHLAPAPRRHLLHDRPRPALGDQAASRAARSTRPRAYKQHVVDQALDAAASAHDRSGACSRRRSCSRRCARRSR